MAADMTGKGWEACFGADSKAHRGYLPTLALTTRGALHWWQNIVTVNKYGGKSETGMPDFGIVLDGGLHFVECKHDSTASGMMLGRLEASKDAGGEDKLTGTGVKPLQAAWMDAATTAGGTCWIAARLEVSTATLRKAAQMRLDGSGADLPPIITRLIPWPTWRALMAAAEDARRRGEVPDASIPAADLAGMGWPCRNAGELLKALGQL
jgi:hypothetical protein